jgi:sodium/potassium/calcium exchanger 2
MRRASRRQGLRGRFVLCCMLIAIAYVGSLYGDAEGPILRSSTGRSLLEASAGDAEEDKPVYGYPNALSEGERPKLIGYIGLLFYMFVALALVCDDYFVPALGRISEYLQLSDDIAGATLMAAGGSAPELFTSFIDTFSAEPSGVGFGTIVGSAVFNVLFVIGACAVFTNGDLKLTWWPLFRDCTYYTLSLCTLACFFGIATPDKMYLWESCTLLSMYLGYCIVMKFNRQLESTVHGFYVGCCGKKKLETGNAEEKASLKQQWEPVKGQEPPGADPPEALDAKGKVPADDGGMYTNPMKAASIRASLEAKELSEAPKLKHRVSNSIGLQAKCGFREALFSVIGNTSSLETAARVGLVAQRCIDVHSMFEEIDLDGDGLVSQEELSAMLEKMNVNISAAVLSAIFLELDIDNDGKVSFEEFSLWYMGSEQRIRAEMENAFCRVAALGSNVIDRQNITNLMNELNTPQTDKQIDEIMMRLAGDKKGTATKAQFKEWYKTSIFWEQKKQDGTLASESSDGPSLSFPSGEGFGAILAWLLVLPLSASLMYSMPNIQHHKYEGRIFHAMIAFVASIAWLGVYSYVMVQCTLIIGDTLGVPPVIMGLVFLAAGTSVPDLLSSMIVAKQGLADMAVSSSIGSNIFDVLIGLPLPWSLYAIMYKRPVTVVAGDTLVVSIFVLVSMLVTIVTIIMLNNWTMTKCLGYSMFTLYFVFILQDLARNPDVNLFG